MRTQAALFLTGFLTFLLISSCASGPQVAAWVSDPVDNVFTFRAKPKDPVQILAYSKSAGYSVYPPLSFQAVESYCAAHYTLGAAAPSFTICKSDPSQLGFVCHAEKCQINTTQNGAICEQSGVDDLVFYADSNHFLALSPPDQTTLFSFCDITLQ